MQLIIVSGLSGSGKTVALRTLEDLGFYCIDNLPAGLMHAFAEQALGDDQDQRVGIGIDARNRRDDIDRLPSIIAELRDKGVRVDIFFLQADTETLLQRFSDTRRKHPLTRTAITLSEAIESERKLLEPIAEQADLLIDTTHTNVHQLRQQIWTRVAPEPGQVSLLLESFAFKHGVPPDVDFSFDARCLPNPHWEQELRPLTGRDAAVAEFLGKQAMVGEMISDLTGMLERWLPRFAEQNRSYITVGVGCTGGRHRSVYIVEQLARHFRATRRNVMARHRELERELE